MIVIDNGTELVSYSVRAWCQDTGLECRSRTASSKALTVACATSA
jgi:hypothetical protein